MTRDEAEAVLTAAGEAGDTGFPLLEAAIACAVHDRPFRDPEPVRTLARSLEGAEAVWRTASFDRVRMRLN